MSAQRRSGTLPALAGIALAVVLFAREDVGAIVGLVIVAGPGLILASLLHAAPIAVNARAWQLLFARPARPSLRLLLFATWVRESVNGLLPVARVGGELAAFRILRHGNVDAADGAATLIADMALSLLSQTAFALVGIALLIGTGQALEPMVSLVAVTALLAIAGIIVLLALRSHVLSAVTQVFDRLVGGRLDALVTGTIRIDEVLSGIYARRRDAAACLAWQLAGWIAGAIEIWLALYFLGHPRSVLDAIAIEALIQAISSAAFVVPGAFGVQEGGFLLLGAVLGIDGPTALALASARRIRDVVVFFPGLVAWQRSESRANREATAHVAQPQ